MNPRITLMTLQAVSKEEYRQIAEVQKMALLKQLYDVLIVGSEVAEVYTLLTADVTDHKTNNYIKNKIFWIADKIKESQAEQYEIKGYSIEPDLSSDTQIMYANVLSDYETRIDFLADVRICLENKLQSV